MKLTSLIFLMLFLSPHSHAQQEPSQYLAEGIAANQARAYSDAINYLTQFLKSDPQNAVGRFNRALAYYFTGDFHDALTDVNTAIENDGNYKEAFNLRGLINTALNIYSDAINDFTSALNLDPNYAEAYLGRALVYKVQNDYPQAISDLNMALNSNPNLIDAYFYRGEVYESMGNYNDALKDLNTYIANVSDKAAAYSARGLANYQTGKYKEAVDDFEKAINLNPSLGPDLNNVLNDAKNKSK